MKIHRCNLLNIIKKDFLEYNKINIFLFLAIAISAHLIVIVTYQTHLLMIKQEKLLTEYRKSSIKLKHLTIEEYIMSKNKI